MIDEWMIECFKENDWMNNWLDNWMIERLNVWIIDWLNDFRLKIVRLNDWWKNDWMI